LSWVTRTGALPSTGLAVSLTMTPSTLQSFGYAKAAARYAPDRSPDKEM
jgi:hypothetical protein